MTAVPAAGRPKERLLWLDITRVLCALMILGIHWLRAGFYVGLFGTGDPVNLVMDYQGQSGAFRLFHYILIAGPERSLQAVTTNVIGLLGGFGWEAVSALILISGFSLAIVQRGTAPNRREWLTWFARRAKRILVPFYIVAIPFLALYAAAVAVLHNTHGHAIASIIQSKLLSHFHTPAPGVILSHLFLFDPYAYQWMPDFFAPAWWFVPAILLAYAAYPFVSKAARFRNGIPLLVATAVVTMAAYHLSDARVLVNESWYYIVLHESFNFSLGVVLGGAWIGAGRSMLERLIRSPGAAAIAFAAFVLGNVANWTPALRPMASMVYGPSLVLVIVFIAKQLEGRRIGRALTSVDAYDLYLVHQPFAFPIALASRVLFHGYAVFAGWFVFVATATLAANVLTRLQKPFFSPANGMVGAAIARAGVAGRWLLNARHGAAAIAQTIATKFLIAAINVGTGIVTVRALGAAGRGELAAITLWPALLTYLLTLGLPTAVRYCVRREPERTSEFYTVAVVMAAAISFVAFAAGVCLIPLWLRAYPADIVRAAQIAMIFAPEVMLHLVLTAMLEARGDFSLANATRYIPAVLTLVALLAMSLAHALTPFLAALAYLAPPVLTASWLVWKLRHLFAARAFDPRPGFRTLGSYGGRAYGLDILATLSTQVDQVLVIGLLSAGNMGMYVVALNGSRVLQILHTAVVTVVLPSAAGLERSRVIAVVARAARVSTVIAGIFAVLLIVAFPVLIPLFYGPGFEAAVRVAQVLTIEALAGGMAVVLAQSFMALGRPGLVTILQAVGLAVAVPSMLILMPRYGLMGAAIALLISTATRLALVLAAYPLILHARPPGILPEPADFASLRRSFSTAR